MLKPGKSIQQPLKGPNSSGSKASNDLGPPVLLVGENRDTYDSLLARVTAAVDPCDIIEEFWVRDVVDLVWEVLRLRRLKAHLLTSSTREGLLIVLTTLGHPFEMKALVDGWYGRDQDKVQQVDALLEQAGLTMDAVMAHTLARRFDDVERIDRMIANAESRRHVVLREVDRHREALAARLRHATHKIEDAEFSEVTKSESGGDERSSP